MVHTTLSKGEHIALGRRKGHIIKVQVKRTRRHTNRAQVKGTGEIL